jgi:hypothetical protein
LPIQLSQLGALYDLDGRRAEALASLLARSSRVRRGRGAAWEVRGRVLVRGERHASLTIFDPDGPGPAGPRPLFQVDRNGHLVWAIARDAAGRLTHAKLRAFDGHWIGVRRGVAGHPIWGASDLVVALGGGTGFVEREALAVFQSVDYERLAFIPPLDRPAALPPGGGAALLNLLALLLREQGARGMRYRGPYPTDQLFDALLLSFRPWGGAGDARGRFTAGAEGRALEGRMEDVPPTWRPAPHERVAGGGVELLLRRGVEAVRWRGRTYRAGNRWRPEGAHVVVPGEHGWCAGLRLLGEMVEEHIHLDRSGEVADVCAPPPAPASPGPPWDPLWGETVQAALVVRSPSLLVAALRRVLPEIDFRWGDLRGDLICVRGTQVLASTALLAHLQRCIAQAPGREARLGLAARAVGELLEAVGPPIRRMAQAWLEALPLEGQIAFLNEGAADTLADAKATLAAAFPALCRELARGSCAA